MTPDDPGWATFVELYGALPRQGPGSAAVTRAVLASVPDLPAAPRIVDAGCGSGASTLALAEALPRARILAIDLLDVLLDRLRASAAAAGTGARIETRRGSMDALTEQDVDLLWSEGAAYSVGVERALRHWAQVVRSGGSVVFSEACWFVPVAERPPELVAFWAAEYPEMCDEAGVRAIVEAIGAYDLVSTRRLEREVWMTGFYEPLRRRCAALGPGARPAMAEVIAAAEREIDVFERFGDRFGYTFFVLRRR
jgi:trans-aconitate methyltransferase